MFFPHKYSVDTALLKLKPQLAALLEHQKNGVVIEMSAKKNIRSLEQNNLYWKVLDHIADFYHDTGFLFAIGDARIPFYNSEVAHATFKNLFNVKSTARLSILEFKDYIDKIRFEMITQSHGEYENLIPEDNYIEKTGLIERRA